jgi:hypothetical protein
MTLLRAAVALAAHGDAILEKSGSVLSQLDLGPDPLDVFYCEDVQSVEVGSVAVFPEDEHVRMSILFVRSEDEVPRRVERSLLWPSGRFEFVGRQRLSQ